MAGVSIVAITAAVISFFHVRDLALEAGETELASWLLPISIDGAIAAAAAVILADSRAGRRPAALTWLLLALGILGSLAANIASAEPTMIARAVASWPPVALALGIEVLSGLARRTSEQSEPANTSAEPAPAPAPADSPAEPARVPADLAPIGLYPAGERADLVPARLGTLPGRPAAAVPAADVPVPAKVVPVERVPVAVPARAGAGDARVKAPVTDRPVAPAGYDTGRPAVASRRLSAKDQADIEVIRRLDEAAGPGEVASRKDIEKQLGCGGSRAARLAGLARG